MNTKNVVKAVVIITVFSVLTRLLGFLFRIYLSWELGAELLGVYQVAFSILGVLMALIGSGLPLALSKRTAIYTTENNPSKIWKSTSATLYISLGVAFFICFFIFAFQNYFVFLFADERCMTILLTLLPAVLFCVFHTTLRGTMWGQKKFFWVGFTEFIEQIIRILMFFLFTFWLTKELDGAINAGLSLSAGCLISSAFVIVCYFVLGNRLGNPKSEYKFIIKSATPITGVRVATSLMQPLIAIIIPLQLVASGWSNEGAMAELGIAVGMTLPLLFLPSTLVGSLATVLLPELTSSLQQKQYKNAEKQVQSAFVFSIFISMMIVPLYMGMSEDIGLFVYNNSKAGYYLLLSAWIMVPLSISNISSTILNAMGLEGKSFKNYIIGAIFLVVCCFMLTKSIGVCSLIVGTGGCMILTSLLNIRMIKKRINLGNSIIYSCFGMFLIAIPSALLTYLLFGIVDIYLPKFFALAFCSGAGGLCFVVLCFVFRIFDVSKVVIEIKKRRSLEKPLKSKFDTLNTMSNNN